MLVMGRKCGQSIVLPQSGITFTILEIGRGRVRVGVSAPHGVTVHRQEVWQRIESPGIEERAQKHR